MINPQWRELPMSQFMVSKVFKPTKFECMMFICSIYMHRPSMKAMLYCICLLIYLSPPPPPPPPPIQQILQYMSFWRNKENVYTDIYPNYLLLWKEDLLTLVLLNPDIPCHCKQWRSRSVGFWRSQLIWICTVCHSVCEYVSTTWIK